MTNGRGPVANGALTPRGERTRQKLLAATRDVVSDRGYDQMTIDDIVTAAGVAHGTFYLYFRSKEDVFVGIAHDVADEIKQAAEEAPPEPLSRPDRIRYGTANYFRTYMKYRRLTGEFVAQASRIPEINERVMDIRHAFARVVRARLERDMGNPEGFDVDIASYAMTGMVSWFAFDWLFSEAFPFDETKFDEVVETLSRIWYAAEQYGPDADLMHDASREALLAAATPADREGPAG